MSVGLLAPSPVQWLIINEPDVKQRIEKFIIGQAEPTLEVAGPPSAEDFIRYKDNPGGPITLPCVRLRLKMFKHHLTGDRGVEVTCSDDDLREIADWQRAARIKGALKGKH